MAGIGFELKKLFSRRGLFASFRAYGYAGIICTGPMLLGIVLLLGVMLSQKDMPDDIKAAVPAYIKSHVDRNICKINF